MGLPDGQIYALVFGGCVLIVIVVVTLSPFVPWIGRHVRSFRSICRLLACYYLLYPPLVARRRVVGPWTRYGGLVRLLYWAGNVILLCIRTRTWDQASLRAAQLTSGNMVALYCGWQLEATASVLRMSAQHYHQLHSTVGWIVLCLATFHAVVMAWVRPRPIFLSDPNAISQNIVFFMVFLISFRAAFSPFFKYIRCYIRVHQLSAYVLLIALCIHLKDAPLWSRWTAWITGLVFILVSIATLGRQLYLIGCMFATVTVSKTLHDFTLDIALPAGAKVRSGQYLVVGRLFRCARAFTVHKRRNEKKGVTFQAWGDLTDDWLDDNERIEKTCLGNLWQVQGPYDAPQHVPRRGRVVVVASGTHLASILPVLKKVLTDHRRSNNPCNRVEVAWFLANRNSFNEKHKRMVEPMLRLNLNLNEAVDGDPFEDENSERENTGEQRAEEQHAEEKRSEEKHSDGRTLITLDKTLSLHLNIFLKSGHAPSSRRQKFYNINDDPPFEPDDAPGGAVLRQTYGRETHDLNLLPLHRPVKPPVDHPDPQPRWLQWYLKRSLAPDRTDLGTEQADAGSNETSLIVSATDDIQTEARKAVLSEKSRYVTLYTV